MKITLLTLTANLLFSLCTLTAQGDSTYLYNYEKYGSLIGLPHITPKGDIIQLATKKIDDSKKYDNHILVRDSLGYFKKLLRLELPETTRLIRFIGQEKDKFYLIGEYKVPDSCCDKVRFVALVNQKGKILWMTKIAIPSLSQNYTEYGLTDEGDLLLVVPIIAEGAYARKDFERWEIHKIDVKGNLVWKQVISNEYDHLPGNIITQKDNIYLGIVRENDRGTLPIEGYVYKLNNQGEILKIDTLSKQMEWSGKITLHTKPNGFFAHFARSGRASVLIFFNSIGERIRDLKFREAIEPMVVEGKLYGFRRNYRFQIKEDNQLGDFGTTSWRGNYPVAYKDGRFYSVLSSGELTVFNTNGTITYGKSTYQNPPMPYREADYSTLTKFELPQLLTDNNLGKVDELFLVDINGDGWKDLFLVNGSEYMQWYAGDGKGGFLPEPKYVGSPKKLLERNAQASYIGVAIGDVNQDRLPDIVFTLFDVAHTPTIFWYKNLGKGRFSERQPLSNAIEADRLFIVDLDQDGENEVISTSKLMDGMFYHELGNASDWGKSFINLKINANVYFLDMDHDGDLDVFTFNQYGDKKVGYFENPSSLMQEWDFVDWGDFSKQSTATGAFQSSESKDTLSIAKRAKAILIGSDTLMQFYDYPSFIKLYDFNGDGQNDVFTVEVDRGPVIGINDNGKIIETKLYEFGGNSNLGKEFNVNLDQDLEYELIYYRYNQQYIFGLDRTTDERIVAAPQFSSLGDGFIHDINQDGLEDLVLDITNQSVNGKTVAFLQQENGVSVEQNAILQKNLPLGGKTLYIGNLVNSAKNFTDVLTHGKTTSELLWYRYTPKGDEYIRELVDSIHFDNAIFNARIMDFNNDGKLDLFLQEEKSRRTAYWLVIQNNRFSSPKLVKGLPEDYYFQFKPAPSDLDSVNIICLNYSSYRSLVVAYNMTNEGKLTNRVELGSIKAGIKHFWLHDLDRNGYTDILLPGEKKFYWLQNTDRGFAAQSLPMGTYYSSLMYDFDEDGDLDFFDFQQSSYGYRENVDGKGLFADRQVLGKIHDAKFNRHHYLFDVNNDGKKDIVVGIQGGGIVYSLKK